MNIVGLFSFFQPESLPFNDNTGSFLIALFQTLLALGLVCVLAYIILRWVLPKINLKKTHNSITRIVDVISLEPRKALYIIEIAGCYFLIATSDSGVHTISRLNTEAIEKRLAETDTVVSVPPTKSLTVLRDVLTKNIPKFINRK